MRNGQLIETSRTVHKVYESGTGTPLVMLHGWPESSFCWDSVLPLMNTGLRVICPDLRGLGDSERTPGRAAYTKDALAEDIWSILDELGIARCELVGHDWGGVVAQEISFATPSSIWQ